MSASKRTHSRKRKLDQLTLWVSPQEKAEVKRRAEAAKISVSKAGRALLVEMLQQDLQTQHAALLEPTLDRIFSKNMKRMAFLVIRDAFTNEYTKAITINILNNLPGMTQSLVQDIITRSTDTAKRNMLRRTPQLETVLQEVESWFREGDKATG